jgi:hypothetical protein
MMLALLYFFITSSSRPILAVRQLQEAKGICT